VIISIKSLKYNDDMRSKPKKTAAILFIGILISAILSTCKVDVAEDAADGYADTTSPTVLSVNPADDSTDVDPKSIDSISVAFSEQMDQSSLTSSTFAVDNGSTELTGTYTCSDTTCSFLPSSKFTYDSTYDITLSTEVKDIGGVALS
jgi:Big-like domain-containing protein